MNPIPLTLAIALGTLSVGAQRATETLELQKRATTFEYGAVKVGKHTLADLPPGSQWRLGMNAASIWRAEMPILVGDRVLPPGEYRTNLQRINGKSCVIFAQGSAMAFGGGSDGDIRIEGELKTAKKATKKLVITWQKAKAKAKVKNTQPATLKVQFGEHEIVGAVTLLGGKTAKLGRYKLTVFALPAAAVTGRDKVPVPVACITRKKESWNVVLGSGQARLVPWMVAPTANFGFGNIEPPNEKMMTTGSVEAVAAEVENPIEALELRESSFKKGQFVLKLAAGKEVLTVSLPEPPKKAK